MEQKTAAITAAVLLDRGGAGYDPAYHNPCISHIRLRNIKGHTADFGDTLLPQIPTAEPSAGRWQTAARARGGRMMTIETYEIFFGIIANLDALYKILEVILIILGIYCCLTYLKM